MFYDLFTAFAVLVLLWAAVVVLFWVDGRYGGE
jgi:hypothetical protein